MEKQDEKRPYAEIGRLVHDLRAREGMSQSELARRIGLHPSYLCRLEKGERRPSIPTLKKIAEVFDRPLEKLLVAAGHIEKDFRERVEGSETMMIPKGLQAVMRLIKGAMANEIRTDKSITPKDREKLLGILEKVSPL